MRRGQYFERYFAIIGTGIGRRDIFGNGVYLVDVVDIRTYLFDVAIAPFADC